jgi:hypothetical protein
MSYRKPNIKKEPPEPELTPRLLAIKKEYEDLGLEYVLSEVDKREVMYAQYAKRYPETFTYTLNRMIRVQFDNKEYLIWRVGYEFRDKYFKLHRDTFRYGWHPLPVTTQILNEYGAVEELQVENWKPVFETEFNEKFIKDLIAGSRTGKPKETLVAIGAIRGMSEPFSSPVYSVFNFEEWLTGPFDELYAAGSLGTYLQPKKGGLESYIRVKNSMLLDQTPPGATKTKSE